ncbi:helix-turn-helix domain-containing protein, partial [Candidatus Frankia alpina]
MSRYRLDPTAGQVAVLDRYCGQNRFLWNPGPREDRFRLRSATRSIGPVV